MSKVVKLNTKSEWQVALESFNKQKLKEPLFITTDLDYTDADFFLELNDHNRNMLDRLVIRYEEFMNDNKWLLNGECIKVAPDGTLLDGQHRMEALRRHKKPVRMSMALGVNPKTFIVNDTGKSRTTSDILAIAGYKNTTGISAALRYFIWYKTSENFINCPDISPNLALTSMKKWPQFQYFVKPSHPFRALGSQSIFHFFMYVTQTIDPELSYDFFYKLETGEKLGKTSSILMLRKMFLGYKAKSLSLDKRHKMASLILAWNSFVENTRIKTVKWSGRDFPIITGVDRDVLFSQGSGLGKTEYSE